MSEKTENNEEKSAETAENTLTGHNVSERTNARMREKYYLSKKDVFSSIQTTSHADPNRFSKIIRHGARPTAKPVMIHCNRTPPPGEIRVDVIREESTVKGIRINCPCGRHTEVNFEYKPASTDK